MISRMFDFSHVTWPSVGIFLIAVAAVIGGDEARPFLLELLPAVAVGKVIALAKLITLFALWKAYSPNFQPLGAPKKP